MKKKTFPIDNRDIYDNQRDQVHSVLLRMLKIISSICKKHNIVFWLEYGTMLGAIRHKGFIPWDMEADIGMMRKDFEKLTKIIERNLPNDIFFQTGKTDPFYIQSEFIEAKFRDRYSNYIGFQKSCPTAKWHNGIQIDVFVFDHYRLAEDEFLLNNFEIKYNQCKSFYKITEIEELIETDFEDTRFFIPIGFDRYLKRNYKNYMTLPSAKERIVEEVLPTNACDHPHALIWENSKTS